MGNGVDVILQILSTSSIFVAKTCHQISSHRWGWNFVNFINSREKYLDDILPQEEPDEDKEEKCFENYFTKYLRIFKYLDDALPQRRRTTSIEEDDKQEEH